MGAFVHPKRERRTEEGAAAVEFALVAGLLITLLFGIIDFGWMVNRDTMVNNAAREGAREASLNPNDADVKQVARSSLSSLPPAEVDVEFSCKKPDSSACNVTASDASAPASGDVAIVTVSYDHDWLTPVIAGIFGSKITLAKSTQMRIE